MTQADRVLSTPPTNTSPLLEAKPPLGVPWIPRFNGARKTRGAPVPRSLEQIRPKRVIQYAQSQIGDWPDENAADRECCDPRHASPAYDANGRNGDDDGPAKAKINKDGGRPRREGENFATQLVAETTQSPAGLISGIDFPVQGAKIRQTHHRQAMMVLFALVVLLHQMPGKAFAGSPCLGAVCQSAINAQGAIDGQCIHGHISRRFERLNGKAQCG
jgi:hypothetical protein